jgi:predicted RNase H-like HicB family nuclease
MSVASGTPYRVEVEQEADGRWLADVVDLAGVMAYGDSREHAISNAEALALRVIADLLEHGEYDRDPTISFAASAAE